MERQNNLNLKIPTEVVIKLVEDHPRNGETIRIMLSTEGEVVNAPPIELKNGK